MSNKNECRSCSKEPTGHVNVARFIQKLDKCFEKNDLQEAVRLVKIWEVEARSLDDERGLLSVLNEQLGLFRRLNDEENAMSAASAVCEILQSEEVENIAHATIFINLATTYRAFGRFDEARKYFASAKLAYLGHTKTQTYEFASLLNNESSLFSELGEYDKAEKDLNDAVKILEYIGLHDAEIALSMINLAHIYYDRAIAEGVKDKSAVYEKIEQTLDFAWEKINSDAQIRDANYAFVISKCAPSYEYFGRKTEAQALKDVAAEIYGRQ